MKVGHLYCLALLRELKVNTFAEAIDWLEDTLDKLIAKAPKGSLKITLHVTGNTSPAILSKESPAEKSSSSSEKGSSLESIRSLIYQRADLTSAVLAAAGSVPSQTLGIAGMPVLLSCTGRC